jgi:hypothetical protein
MDTPSAGFLREDEWIPKDWPTYTCVLLENADKTQPPPVNPKSQKKRKKGETDSERLKRQGHTKHAQKKSPPSLTTTYIQNRMT